MTFLGTSCSLGILRRKKNIKTVLFKIALVNDTWHYAKISIFALKNLKITCNVWWSKVHDSFVNAFFEYQLYLGNIVRSLFRPAGVYHKNTTFSTGHFSPEEPLKAGTTSQPVSMSGRTGMCVLAVKLPSTHTPVQKKILKTLVF